MLRLRQPNYGYYLRKRDKNFLIAKANRDSQIAPSFCDGPFVTIDCKEHQGYEGGGYSICASDRWFLTFE